MKIKYHHDTIFSSLARIAVEEDEKEAETARLDSAVDLSSIQLVGVRCLRFKLLETVWNPIGSSTMQDEEASMEGIRTEN